MSRQDTHDDFVAVWYMRVCKRDGRMEQMCLNKITDRLTKLQAPVGHTHRMVGHLQALDVDCVLVAQKTCAGLVDGILTTRIDEISSEVAVGLTTTHPDYETLAARILISNLHKKTSASVLETFTSLANYKNSNGDHTPLVNGDVMNCIQQHAHVLQNAVMYDNDFDYSYFGLKTLMKGYLQPRENPIERPQHMLLRVSVGIWGTDIANVVKTYRLLSSKKYTHATPSLFNLGTCAPHSASCYLMGTEDSVEALGESWTKASIISKSAGGIGLNITNVRGNGSIIRGTGGRSNGLVPLAQTFNMLTKWINQGGKRNGALALYLEPWHVDVCEFIQLRRPQGAEDLRARNIFLALWLNDLFMERVKQGSMWSLMDPDVCPGLTEQWGCGFNALYTDYERQGKYRRQIKAQDLWNLILRCQVESGMPYLLNKDASNAKSNQSNLGTIKCSNLCSEIIQFSDHHNTSVCNLASIALSRFVNNGQYDYRELHAVVQHVTMCLDHMLDVCAYPVPDAKTTNLRDRPLGIGVQGLADTFVALRLPFDSPEAAAINRNIFETMYHAALTASVGLAEAKGTYLSYTHSPASKGRLQFDLWNQTDPDGFPTNSTHMFDWPALRHKIKQYGLRNSLLIALMPTCSTSQILGCCESFQPINSNIYTRKTGAGSFVCINKPLVQDLHNLNLWSSHMKDQIIIADGSIQNIPQIPQHLKSLYKTIWEIKQKCCIDLAADRAPFVCQSQSMNLFLPEHSLRKLSAMLIYAWEKRLKTLSYYLHCRPEAKAVQVTTAPPECTACTA